MSAKPAVLKLPEDRRALVAIDLGAESCRVSLLRWLGEEPLIEVVHRFANHAAQQGGGLRWNMTVILYELNLGLTLCAERASEGIRSIAVDGWAVDYVRLDDEGRRVAEPFCYRDPRTLAAQAELHKRISAERMRELTGVAVMPLNTVYQMAADDEEQQRLSWLNLPEYVLYTLGARPAAELTNASHTQLLGADGQWSQEILDALGVPGTLMPTVVMPGTQVGLLCSPLCDLPGFGHDVRLIAPACHDTASAVAAIPDDGEDWAYISSGTWSLVGKVISGQINTRDAKDDNFTNLGGVDGTTCFHKNLNGMWLMRQCLESWNDAAAVGERAHLTIAALVEAAASFGPWAYSLDVDDLELLLPGHMPERINAQLLRRGLPQFDPSPAAAAQLTSFIFHSLARRYAEVLERVSSITNTPLRRLYLMGGGSRNSLLNRLTAEATGLSIFLAGAECSTVGNFASQLASLEQTKGHRPTAQWASMLSQVAAQEVGQSG